MTIACWYRSLMNGWRMQRSYARSRRSLRSFREALGLQVHRMSDDEVDASVVNFSLLARMHGMSVEDVAAAVRHVREAHQHARGQRRPTYH
jgi:hypothetical protein